MGLLSRLVDAGGFLHPKIDDRPMTAYEEPAMSANSASNRFAVLPDDETLAETVVELEAHGLTAQPSCERSRLSRDSKPSAR
jgi:hypothetical protein